MDIYQKRRMNLRDIRKGFNYQKDLADAVGLAPSYVSQLLADSGKKGYRNIGEDVARKIERRLKLPAFSLDERPEPKGVEEDKGKFNDTGEAKQRLKAKLETARLSVDDLLLLEKITDRLAAGARS